MIWGNSYGSRKNTSCETGIIQRYLSARSTTKTLVSIWQNIGQSHALAIGHVVDIAFPILSLNRHALSQTHYQNQVTNVQRAYHILTCKDWLMLWQTSIIYSGKHDFLDWIISATIYLGNTANKGSLSGNINYRVSFSMSNMSPTSLINLYLACSALGTDEKSN